ncbi:MAG: conjugal transfer protein TraX [Oscillospiraceae bacterium]|nr:conjugal transfer protein TraX [Oscillospiraceae bacterium]
MKSEQRKLSSHALKVIATIAMTIDHIADLLPSMPFFLRMIGRISAPLFIFTLAYSFQNTTSRKQFLLRIYLASVVMELTKILVFSFDTKSKGIVQNNIFGTLFLAVLIAYCLELLSIYYQSENYLMMFSYLAVLIIIIVWSFVSLNLPETVLWFIKAVAPSITTTEGGVSWVILGAGLCLFAVKRRSVIIFYSCYCLLELIGTILFAGIHTLFYNIQWMMIFALPLMLMYNGNKGKSRKWFFYIYYPVHIWVIYGISVMFRQR